MIFMTSCSYPLFPAFPVASLAILRILKGLSQFHIFHLPLIFNIGVQQVMSFKKKDGY